MLEGQIVDCGPTERQGATRRGRCRPKRRREVQLGVDQPGRPVRNEFDSRRVKNTRPFLKIPDKPGLLVTHKTT